MGSIVKQQTLNKQRTEIDIKDLSSSVYYIKAITSNFTNTKKIEELCTELFIIFFFYNFCLQAQQKHNFGIKYNEGISKISNLSYWDIFLQTIFKSQYYFMPSEQAGVYYNLNRKNVSLNIEVLQKRMFFLVLRLNPSSNTLI